MLITILNKIKKILQFMRN